MNVTPDAGSFQMYCNREVQLKVKMLYIAGQIS